MTGNEKAKGLLYNLTLSKCEGPRGWSQQRLTNSTFDYPSLSSANNRSWTGRRLWTLRYDSDYLRDTGAIYTSHCSSATGLRRRRDWAVVVKPPLGALESRTDRGERTRRKGQDETQRSHRTTLGRLFRLYVWKQTKRALFLDKWDRQGAPRRVPPSNVRA